MIKAIYLRSCEAIIDTCDDRRVRDYTNIGRESDPDGRYAYVLDNNNDVWWHNNYTGVSYLCLYLV